MATTPRATTSVQDTATAKAGGQDLICVLAPVPVQADGVPRQFGSASAIYAQHGYSEGVEYAALHVENTGLPVLFVPLPIDVEGAISRVDQSGNSNTSVVSVAAGSGGVRGEHEGRIRVETGGVVSTDQIVISVSLDDRTWTRVRLGTASSYAIPYVNATVSFGAGSLTAGEIVLTWFGSGPRAASADITMARGTLASMLKFFRSTLLCGDLQDSTEALAYNTELDAYASADERFIFGRASVFDRAPATRLSVVTLRMTGDPNLTFNDDVGGDTVTRSEGSWIDDGVRVGDVITFDGSASNDLSFAVLSVSNSVLGVAGATDEADVAGVTATFSTGLSFDDSSETITRSRGSWLADGFRVGDSVVITGTAGAVNDGTFVIQAGLSALVMTLAAGSVDADAVIGADVLTAFTGPGAQTIPAWAAEVDAAFAAVDAKKREDLSMGRARILSPFSGYWFRRPAAWDASIREYQHDLHIPTWRKSDGPVLGDLFDTNGTLAEYDDRVHGGAASAGRFTSYRTWGNGPAGAFISQSLTREVDASLLSQTHNVAVTNVACTVVQLNAELAIGQSLILNDDGTATEDSLTTIEDRVNNALRSELLENKRGEGPRASSAVWTASRDDVLNVPAAVLNGVCRLSLRGTIHDVVTQVRVLSGGQA